MPVVYVVWIASGLLNQKVHTIGIAASDQGEGRAVISVEPTMCEQFEASVVALDHDQGFPNLAAVLQKKLIA
jgi:hypothetical protein